MPEPLLHFSLPQLAAYSKSVLKEFCCEWGDCQAILNCWTALHQHIKWHIQDQIASKQSGFQCLIKPCSGQGHLSGDGLLMHIQSNHIDHVPLPCPMSECLETFQRHSYIELHLQDAHIHPLVLTTGGELMIPAGLLKRAFCPQQPSLSDSVLQELPNMHSLPMIPLPLIPNPACKQLQLPSNSEPLHWGYWTMPDPQGGSNPDSRSALFPDHTSTSAELEDFVVRPKPPELCDIGLLLARPRHTFPNHPLRPPLLPPRSIGFEVFCTSDSSEGRQSSEIEM